MNVMKKAWEIAKSGQGKFGGKVSEYFAESLRLAWKVKKGQVTLEVKENNNIAGIKSWFINKNFDQNEAFAINNSYCIYTVERETEKAYKLIIHTDYGKIYSWVPKNVCLTEEQERQEAEKAAKAWENGLKRNQELREKAIALGIKGIRKRMRTETLLRKIAEHEAKTA